MWFTRCHLFIVLVVISQANADHCVIPEGKEVVYDWNTIIKAGTYLPAPHASLFILNGKIHLQSTNNSILVQLSNLKYKLYNGILDHVHENEAHAVPISKDIQELEWPFQIVYDNAGLVTGIITESEEKEYSRNIKRAIATNFQLHHDVVSGKDLPNSFIVDEQSIYGRQQIGYTIIQNGQLLEVVKLQSYSNLVKDSSRYSFTNTNPTRCDRYFNDKSPNYQQYKEPVTQSAQKKYWIGQHDGHHIVEKIQVHGEIFYNPFEAKSDSQYILLNQTWKLIEVVTIQNAFSLKSEHLENNLDYLHWVSNNEAIVDVTNGRHIHNYQKLIAAVYKMFEEVLEYLGQDNFTTKIPNIKQGQVINRLQRLLSYLNFNHLDELHDNLVQKTDAHDLKILTIFYQMLPLIGTRASTLLAKKLIVNNLIADEYEVIAILQDLPDHIQEPTVELVKEMEPLITLDTKLSWNIRKVAILAFGKLINKSYLYNYKISNTVHQVYEDYVVKYVNQVKNLENYPERLAYLQGLYNMQLHSMVNHLLPGVRGEWGWDYNLRVWCLWALKPVIITWNSPEDALRILWPILINSNEHTELRATAYYTIMESGPTGPQVYDIHNFMANGKHEELYHLHYSYVKSRAESTQPCKERISRIFTDLAKNLHTPAHGLSSSYLSDFKDFSFSLSGGIETIYISTNESQVFLTTVQSNFIRDFHTDYEWIVRIHGIGGSYLNLANLLGFLTPDSINEVHIEIVAMRNSRIYNYYYIDKHNIHELASVKDRLIAGYRSNPLNIIFARYEKVPLVTDLGTPALWEYLVPMVQSGHINLDVGVVNQVITFNIDARIAYWVHYRHGLSFYNPIADVWQGINRLHSYDDIWPVYWSISLDPEQQNIHLSWRKLKDQLHDVTGIRSHVQQMVFTRDDYHRGILHKSSPNSKEWVVATKGDKYRHDYPIWQYDDLKTARFYQVVIYNSEYHVSNGSFQNLLHFISQPYTKHYPCHLGHLLSTLSNAQSYVTLAPTAGPHGILITAGPNREHDVSSIDISFRFGAAVPDGYNIASPLKFSTYLTYAVKNEEQSLKTWNVNVGINIGKGLKKIDGNIQATIIEPGQKDYQVNIDGSKEFGSENVNGHLIISLDSPSDSVVNITMVGRRSHEQDHEHYVYGACENVIPYSLPPYHTIHCLEAQRSLRHYTYHVKGSNIQNEYKNIVLDGWDRFKSYYIAQYSYDDSESTSKQLPEDELEIDLVFPVVGGEVDLHVATSKRLHHITGIPTSYWEWWGVYPDSVTYSKFYLALYTIGWIDRCEIYPDHFAYNQNQIDGVIPEDWTLYAANANQTPTAAIYIKSVGDDKIALRVVDESHVLEIAPHGVGYQMNLDGRVVERHRQELDWISYNVISDGLNRPIDFILTESGIHVEYDQHHVVALLPKTDNFIYGYCRPETERQNHIDLILL